MATTTPQPLGTRFANKTAIVTGASSGYGLGIALAFAQEGAHVLAADLNPLPADLPAHLAASFTYRRHNVTSRADWDSLYAYADAHHGGVDILVNNAGTSYRNKPTAEVTEADFDLVFAVNVKSIFHSVAALIPTLITPRPISIINIASTGAHRPRPGLVWYNASKGAVLNATKGLAGEYAPAQIRVNAVLPLLGATALFSTFTGVELGEDEEAVKARFVGNVPMGRLCTPQDVAGAVMWLAGEESRFVTGQAIEVDGGKNIG